MHHFTLISSLHLLPLSSTHFSLPHIMGLLSSTIFCTLSVHPQHHQFTILSDARLVHHGHGTLALFAQKLVWLRSVSCDCLSPQKFPNNSVGINILTFFPALIMWQRLFLLLSQILAIPCCISKGLLKKHSPSTYFYGKDFKSSIFYIIFPIFSIKYSCYFSKRMMSMYF